MYRLSQRSLSAMQGIHPALELIVKRAIRITPVDFRVTEGLRTVERQRELLKQGATRTMNSKHLTGHAVDVVALPDGKVSWEWKHYHLIADAFKQAARESGVSLTWGGDWKSFKDGPHFEINLTQTQPAPGSASRA